MKNDSLTSCLRTEERGVKPRNMGTKNFEGDGKSLFLDLLTLK